jgi:hypothetical protein
MAIGRQGSIGKGKSAGPIGKSKGMHGSALTLDQNKTKVGYPTTSTTEAPPPVTTTTSA